MDIELTVIYVVTRRPGYPDIWAHSNVGILFRIIMDALKLI